VSRIIADHEPHTHALFIVTSDLLIEFLVIELQSTKGIIKDSGQGEGDFETNVTGLYSNRTLEPHLVHRRNDETE